MVSRAGALRHRRLALVGALVVLGAAGVVGPLFFLLRIGNGSSPAQGGNPVVRVNVVWTGGPGGIEGSQTWVSLTDSAHRSVWETTIPGLTSRLLLNRRLLPGEYQIRSWRRSCSAFCPNLDPVDDSCRASFEVAAGDRRTITLYVHPGMMCRFDTG